MLLSSIQQLDLPIKEVYGVFLHANMFFWNKFSGFEEAFCGVLQAAYDLNMNVDHFIEAFSVVDVNLNFDTTTRQCVPAHDILSKYRYVIIIMCLRALRRGHSL